MLSDRHADREVRCKPWVHPQPAVATSTMIDRYGPGPRPWLGPGASAADPPRRLARHAGSLPVIAGSLIQLRAWTTYRPAGPEAGMAIVLRHRARPDRGRPALVGVPAPVRPRTHLSLLQADRGLAGPSPPTCAGPGRNPCSRPGRLTPGRVRSGFATSACTPAFRPRHRNPPDPVPLTRTHLRPSTTRPGQREEATGPDDTTGTSKVNRLNLELNAACPLAAAPALWDCPTNGVSGVTDHLSSVAGMRSAKVTAKALRADFHRATHRV